MGRTLSTGNYSEIPIGSNCNENKNLQRKLGIIILKPLFQEQIYEKEESYH
jgi:hypothetical protein